MVSSTMNADVLQDESPEIDRFIEGLNDLPETMRAGEALVAAARLLEFSAFEAAPFEAPMPVGQLIQLAAELSRIATDMSALDPDARKALRVPSYLS